MKAAAIRVFLSIVVVLTSCAHGQLRKRRRSSEMLNNDGNEELSNGFARLEFEGNDSAREDLMDVVIRFKRPETGSFAAQSFSEEVEAVQSMSGCFNALSEPVTVHTMLPMLSSAGAMVSAKVRHLTSFELNPTNLRIRHT